MCMSKSIVVQFIVSLYPEHGFILKLNIHETAKTKSQKVSGYASKANLEEFSDLR